MHFNASSLFALATLALPAFAVRSTRVIELFKREPRDAVSPTAPPSFVEIIVAPPTKIINGHVTTLSPVHTETVPAYTDAKRSVNMEWEDLIVSRPGEEAYTVSTLMSQHQKRKVSAEISPGVGSTQLISSRSYIPRM